MKIIHPTALLIAMSFTFLACGQNEPVFVAASDTYEIDHNKKIIVLNIDSEDDITRKLTSLQLDETYTLVSPTKGLSTSMTLKLKNKEGATYQAFITKSPILSIQVKDSLTKHPKVLAHFRYYDADTTFTSALGMELRGNLSLTFPKKSFNIEFYTDSISKDKKKVKFKDLRKEDDWILDGLYNEALLLRAYTSQKLWKEIHTPAYASSEPKAVATIDGVHVDLFVNNEYRGIYLLSEKVNRSTLKLKKMKGDTVRGELFKAGYYHGGTSFKEAPAFKNSLPHWAGWRMEYPYEDYEAHYDNLYTAIQFMASSTDEDFGNRLHEYMEIDNAIDYFLFINLIRATDNLGKNFYLAKYNANTPYFIVPWDMDGVLGTIQAGKRISTTNDILSNGLFDRMVENPALKQKMNTRWNELRTTSFHSDSLIQRIEKRYDKLKGTKMYERDALAWNISHEAEHLEYMLEWLKNRVAYLDTYFREE